MPPLEPLPESEEDLDLLLGGGRHVALFLHQFGIGVDVLSPRTKLRILRSERSERVFFHPARMVIGRTMPNH